MGAGFALTLDRKRRRQMKSARLLLAAVFLHTLGGCERESLALQDNLNRIDAIAVPTDRLAALVQLDQSNPHAFGVKFRLGELYLYFGQLDVGTVYLREAHRLRSEKGVSKNDARAVALEYARALIMKGRPSEAIPVVMPEAVAGDPAALLVRARAFVQSGNMTGAVGDFRAALGANGAQPAAADFTLYAQALASQRQFTDALSILRECEQRMGYQPGTGLLESSLLEKLGRAAESILCAFKETLYQQSQGTISVDQVDRNLTALSRRTDVAGVADPRTQSIVKGMKAYLHAQWVEAFGSLGKGLAGLDDPFGRFLLLSCSLEKDNVTPRMLADFAGLETRYRTYPDFYFRLWHAMKKGPGDYSLSNVRGVLEKMILLAPDSAEAQETRVELGRLVGIDPREAASILLRPELDLAYARLTSGADPGKVLPPVLRLLSIHRENLYTSEGVLMLKGATWVPGVTRFLGEQARRATGPLKDRLAQLL
jgi:hypothetical protein